MVASANGSKHLLSMGQKREANGYSSPVNLLADQDAWRSSFPGSGNHSPIWVDSWASPGRRCCAARIARIIGCATSWGRSFIGGPPRSRRFPAGHDFGQVALGTIVCDLLADFGYGPRRYSVYSLGESAALFGLRAWTARDEMLRRMQASELFGSELVGECRAARRAWGLADGVPVNWLAAWCPALRKTCAGPSAPKASLFVVNQRLRVRGRRRS